MPTKAGLGTDMPALHPDRTEVVEHQRGAFLACGPIRPDVAVVHVHEADVPRQLPGAARSSSGWTPSW